jgi:hypothetical protein
MYGRKINLLRIVKNITGVRFMKSKYKTIFKNIICIIVLALVHITFLKQTYSSDTWIVCLALLTPPISAAVFSIINNKSKKDIFINFVIITVTASVLDFFVFVWMYVDLMSKFD